MLVLDIGGSFIKLALTDENGRLLPGTVRQVPADASGSYEHFLSLLSGILQLDVKQQDPKRACVSIPGPFDYARGISHMRHKFTALFERSLLPPFEDAGVEVTFLHDSPAFLLGEAEAAAGTSPCGVMLGTGLGFAFMQHGRVCVDENQTPAVTLWNTPYRGGTAEDFISTRALVSAYGEDIPIREMADRARAGDGRATGAFRAMGEALSDLLGRVIPLLHCDSVVLGGQISRSHDLFCLQLPVPMTVSRMPAEAALRGAGRYALLGPASCVALCPHRDLSGEIAL